MTASGDIISLAGARARLGRRDAAWPHAVDAGATAGRASDRSPGDAGVRRRRWLRRVFRRLGDILAVAALLIVPSVAIVALFLGAAWAMWARHGDLAALLGPNGALWAWGGYALVTGAAYAFVARRFAPAILAGWAYVLFMVGIAGWAHVSFGPAALTAASGIAILRLTQS